MKLLTQNAKMKKSSKTSQYEIYNFGITAVKACPFAGACKKGCYATMGAYAWSNVNAAYQARFEFTQTDNFVDSMINEIRTKLKTAKRKGKKCLIRIHDSGDFYNREYVSKWFTIMAAFQNEPVSFYAYTKSIVYFRDAIVPKNFTLIFSYGGKLDSQIDTFKDRHSKVFQSEAELLAAGYANASQDDTVALGDNHKIGLVYHGSKGYNNTEWKNVA